jgi:ketosteroid isomerase-like protein
MSQEHVEIVRSAFAAFEDGDLDRLRGLVSDDVIV